METSSYTNGVLTTDLSLPGIESRNTCLPLEQGQTDYNSSHFQTPGDIPYSRKYWRALNSLWRVTYKHTFNANQRRRR